MSNENLMKRIKDNIDTGHIITIVIFLLAMFGSWITTYYTIKFTAQNNTAAIERLNIKVDNTNNKIESLDNIYLRKNEFLQYKQGRTKQLDAISERIEYLIRLQIETAKDIRQKNQ